MLKLQKCHGDSFLRGGHLQTLWGHFVPSPPLRGERKIHLVPLPDKDQLHCSVIEGKSPFVISLFHGLSGDINSDYMRRTANLMQELGHTVILVNHRGAGEGFQYAKNPYHSGRAEDISEVLRYFKKIFPDKKNISIGFSMSGNILLTLLGGFRGDVLPDAGITVNAPINLARGSELLGKGFNRIYDLRFVQGLRENILNKKRHGLISQEYPISRYITISQFDEIYTAPASGFANAADYYKQCSALQYLKNIKTPTHLLTAADDPFVSVKDYQRELLSNSCYLHIEPTGGHLGYMSKQVTPLGTKRWLDYYLFEAVKNLTQTI